MVVILLRGMMLLCLAFAVTACTSAVSKQSHVENKTIYPLADALTATTQYEVKSNSLTLTPNDTKQDLIRLGTEYFVNAKLLMKYIQFGNADIVFKPTKVSAANIIPISENFTEAEEAISFNGTTYIKLSSIGLKSEAKDNVLWIEK